MIKWIFRLILITLLAAVLHYNLPHRDIVRITDTYEKRVDPGANSWFWSSGMREVPRAPQTATCFYSDNGCQREPARLSQRRYRVRVATLF